MLTQNLGVFARTSILLFLYTVHDVSSVVTCFKMTFWTDLTSYEPLFITSPM